MMADWHRTGMLARILLSKYCTLKFDGCFCVSADMSNAEPDVIVVIALPSTAPLVANGNSVVNSS